jgi:hypothetical protein
VNEQTPSSEPAKPKDIPPLPAAYLLATSTPRSARLPFSRWWVVIIGVGYGILLRVIFGLDLINALNGVMSFAFAFGVPFVVGAIPPIVFREQESTTAQELSLSFVTVSLFVLGTGVVLLEGLICMIMALPLFCMSGLFGCLFAQLWLAIFRPKRGIYAIGFLPFVILAVEKNFSVPDVDSSVSRSIEIAAEPMRVWASLADTDIAAQVYDGTVARFLTIPLPLSGHTRTEDAGAPVQRIRRSSWEKSVYFDCLITHWEPGKHMRWTYKFYPDSFPKHAMDDHIVIGGRYFDLKETNYVLEPAQVNGAPGTKLYIQTRYRVSTNYNWYSDWWAQVVIGNFMERSVQHYRDQSEKEPG